MIRAAALALSVALAACGPGTTVAPPAADSGKVAITDRTASEIEALLQKRAETLQAKDLAGFQSTFDGTRSALRRCQGEAFEIASRQGANPAPKVGKVEPYLDQYVRAYVGSDANGYQRLYFRKEGGRWILTEPKDDELGGDRAKKINDIDLTYYGIDDDIVEVYAKAGAAARDFVLTVVRGKTGTPFGLRIFPTRGAAGPTVGCSVAGFHLQNNPNDHFIRLFSNGLSFKREFTEMTDSTVALIRHEGLHWAQDQMIPGITARLDWWLSEGWPDYVGEFRALATKKQVICTTPTPTFKQLVDGIQITPETPPELPGQMYSFANSMVEYLEVTFGKDAYFDLMQAYKDSVDPKITYPKVLKVSPEQFYDGWKVWSKQKFC
ncbi:MAG TPA: hypothetical protein VFW12_02760 [Candidatus Limnocylindria bacterium]|nr:hypothetical protein [Candidatus Limnocylindria bacterium]